MTRVAHHRSLSSQETDPGGALGCQLPYRIGRGLARLSWLAFEMDGFYPFTAFPPGLGFHRLKVQAGLCPCEVSLFKVLLWRDSRVYW